MEEEDGKKMEVPENMLERIGKNKYRLTTKFNDTHIRVDEFDDAFLRMSYKQGVDEYNSLLEQLGKVNKVLKDADYSDGDVEEIEDFIELNNKAAKYNEFVKSKNQRDNIVDMMKRLSAQKEDIERVAPEVKRSKKK